jgi:hypothetical protein
MPLCLSFLQDLLFYSFHIGVPCVCVCVCVHSRLGGWEWTERLIKNFIFDLLEIFSHFLFTIILFPLFLKRKMKVYDIFAATACVNCKSFVTSV